MDAALSRSAVGSGNSPFLPNKTHGGMSWRPREFGHPDDFEGNFRVSFVRRERNASCAVPCRSSSLNFRNDDGVDHRETFAPTRRDRDAQNWPPQYAYARCALLPQSLPNAWHVGGRIRSILFSSAHQNGRIIEKFAHYSAGPPNPVIFSFTPQAADTGRKEHKSIT